MYVNTVAPGEGGVQASFLPTRASIATSASFTDWKSVGSVFDWFAWSVSPALGRYIACHGVFDPGATNVM